MDRRAQIETYLMREMEEREKFDLSLAKLLISEFPIFRELDTETPLEAEVVKKIGRYHLSLVRTFE